MDFRIFAFAANGIFFLVCPLACGAITYDIAPYDGTDSPWSVDGGFITTDGTLGSISPLNFVSWELSFTSPSGVSKISSEDGGAFLHVNSYVIVTSDNQPNPPSLIATGSQLFANPTLRGHLMLFFANQNIYAEKFTGKLVAYTPFYGGYIGSSYLSTGGLILDNTVDSTNPDNPFASNPNIILGQVNNLNRSYLSVPSGPVIIGTTAIPEPAGLLISVVGCLWLLLYRGRFRSSQY